MRRLIIVIALAGVLMSACQNEQAAVNNGGGNVGDGREYTYEITYITGDEIYGIPVEPEASEGNRRIFLYEHEVPFEVAEGDRIIVVWGDEEDEFKRIELAGDKQEISRIMGELKADMGSEYFVGCADGWTLAEDESCTK